MRIRFKTMSGERRVVITRLQRKKVEREMEKKNQVKKEESKRRR
jgi:hypothetical protein